MTKVLRDSDGLSPNESRFAKFLCQGMSQREAFRRAWPKTRAKPHQIDNRASELANKPEVRRRCREILASMKLADLDSGPGAFKDLLDALAAATAARNWTAVASLSRLRLDCMGCLKSTHVGMAESSLSDEIILTKLAGDNAELRKQLQQLLGSESFEKTDPPKPEPKMAEPAPTKH